MPRVTKPRPGEPIRLVQTKAGETRYEVVLTVSEQGSTKRHQTRRRFTTLTEARASVDETRTAVRRGTFTPTSATSLAELADQWLSTRRDIRPVSVEGYRQVLKPVTAAHGDRRVQSITRADVERWVQSWRTTGGVRGRGLSHRSVVYTLQTLRQVLALGVAQGLMVKNPADGVKPPRKVAEDRQTVVVWSVAELGQFVRQADTHPLAAAWRLSACGLRRSEVLGLDWSAVDWATGSVRIEQGRVKIGTSKTTATDEPKSRASRRTVPVEMIMPGTRAALRELRVRQGQPSAGLVVVDAAGQPLHPDTYGDMFRDTARAAGVPVIRLHAIRHTIASALHDAGEPPAAVARMLGHEVGTHMQFYVTSNDDAVTRAASRFGAVLSGAPAAATS